MKVGDLVTLKGFPDQIMSVVDVPPAPENGKAPPIQTSWFFNGEIHSCGFWPDSLDPVEAPATELNAQLQEVNEASARMLRDMNALDEELKAKRKRLLEILDDHQRALAAVLKAYPEFNGNSITEAVNAMVERYETIKREANEQIERLKQQI